MIEDDLSASPVRLRQEIKMLRAALPADWRNLEWGIPSMRDQVISVMKAHLCPINETDMACACPGTCMQWAEKIMLDIEATGFIITKLRNL